MGEEYREEIIALLDKIKDAGALAYLHTFIKLFAEKWGWPTSLFFSKALIQSYP